MENRYAAQERRKKAIDLIWINSDPTRWEEAVSLLQEAIDLGDIESYYYLGRCYVWGDAGKGAFGNQDEGIRLYKEGAALGSSLCVIGLERAQNLDSETISECVKSPREAFTNVMDMALNGDPYPCYLIGNAYYFNDIDTYSYMPDTMEPEQKVKLWKQEAKRWFHRAVDMGVLHAMNNLANLYEDEDNDTQSAMRYLQMAAQSNSGSACTNIAQHYLHGIGVPKDPDEEFKWYQKGAELRDEYCLWRMGQAWEIGELGEEDDVKAHQYYLEALALGSEFAPGSLGREYECGWGVESDYAKAVEYYLLDLETEEDPNTPLYLGDIFITGGDSIEQDLERAWCYYIQAKEMGSEEAPERLKKFREDYPKIANDHEFLDAKSAYEDGQQGSAMALVHYYMQHMEGGPGRDANKALDLLEEALEQGDTAEAFKKLTAIGNGYMGDAERPKALEILERTYQEGLDGAGFALAMVLREMKPGKGANTDSPIYKRSVILLEEAIQKGNLEAYSWLSGMYLMGRGVKLSLQQAISILTSGLEAGSAGCARDLANLYYMGGIYGGVRMKSDYAKALAYAQQAVEGGCVEGYVVLGTGYLFGKGVRRDKIKAQEYFMLGYEQKSAECALKLAWMLTLKSIGRDQEAINQRFRYYWDAFEWGERTAVSKVAEAYLCGDGVEMNESFAINLFEQSVAIGSRSGASWLCKCYRNGIGVEKDRDKAKEFKILSKTLPYE